MKKFLLIPILLLLSNCDRLKTAKSVDYYLEHQDELLVKIKYCYNAPSFEANTEECRIVRRAQYELAQTHPTAIKLKK